MKRKHPFTLLEMVIGMSLAALLIGFLFTTFQQTALGNSKIKPAQKEVHQRVCLQIRLSTLFGSLEFERNKTDFYTAPHPESYNEALYFSFKQEVDANPDFIGLVNGVLFVKQPQGQLCLDTFSTSGSIRHEVFLENIKELSFQFVDGQKGKMETHWPKEADFPPSLLKLLVTEKEIKIPVEFGFSLKNPPEIIYFKEDNNIK